MNFSRECIDSVECFVVIMNHMRDRCEASRIMAMATTYERLMAWVDDLKTEPYRDEGYYKVFKKGSPLEWYNPPTSYEVGQLNHWGQGVDRGLCKMSGILSGNVENNDGIIIIDKEEILREYEQWKSAQDG